MKHQTKIRVLSFFMALLLSGCGLNHSENLIDPETNTVNPIITEMVEQSDGTPESYEDTPETDSSEQGQSDGNDITDATDEELPDDTESGRRRTA